LDTGEREKERPGSRDTGVGLGGDGDTSLNGVAGANSGFGVVSMYER